MLTMKRNHNSALFQWLHEEFDVIEKLSSGNAAFPLEANAECRENLYTRSFRRFQQQVCFHTLKSLC